MDVLSALKKAITHSGISNYDLSKALGKTPAYVSVIFSRGSVPKTDTFAKIADAAGYDLLLRSRDDEIEIVIDPPFED